MASHIIDLLVQMVISVISHVGYGGVFFLMFLTSCCVPIPSEVIMPFAGFTVATGQLILSPVIIAGVLGDLAGSSLAYLIGKGGGRPLIEKYGKYVLISHHDLDIADGWFQRFGELTVFFGRMLPVIRTYVAFPAGISEMNYPRFAIYTVLGASVWISVLAYLGTKLGSNWSAIRDRMHSFDSAIILIVLVGIGLYIWRHVKNSKK